MRIALIILAILVAILVEAVAAAADGNWIIPPGGTVPPEPQPEPGDSESAPCATEIVIVYPRWFMPIVLVPPGN